MRYSCAVGVVTSLTIVYLFSGPVFADTNLPVPLVQLTSPGMVATDLAAKDIEVTLHRAQHGDVDAQVEIWSRRCQGLR
jgi:hypothetical protein